jgi:NAD(P)-dependent dehydrogenase (short-subunit alcohol dehydrogenase family)
MGGFGPLPGATAYAASKHGTVAYWKAINDALARGELSGFE